MEANLLKILATALIVVSVVSATTAITKFKRILQLKAEIVQLKTDYSILEEEFATRGRKIITLEQEIRELKNPNPGVKKVVLKKSKPQTTDY